VNSVLSPGVRVDVGAVIRDSIVMFDSVIRSGAVVDRAILDKEVVIGPGAIVGDGPDFDTPNKQEPGRLNTGITVVGKRAVIPRGVRIGRNVKIAGDVKANDFPSRTVKSGSSVESARPRTAAARLAAANRAAEKRVAIPIDSSTNGKHEIVPAVQAGRSSGSGSKR
jgi:glucose-1-phosphate adenylyltransferase